MDINDMRVVMTVLAFIAFMGIIAWACGSGRKSRFDDAARLPFSWEADEELATIRAVEDER